MRNATLRKELRAGRGDTTTEALEKLGENQAGS